jgi:hypothetical protein
MDPLEDFFAPDTSQAEAKAVFWKKWGASPGRLWDAPKVLSNSIGELCAHNYNAGD